MRVFVAQSAVLMPLTRVCVEFAFKFVRLPVAALEGCEEEIVARIEVRDAGDYGSGDADSLEHSILL